MARLFVSQSSIATVEMQITKEDSQRKIVMQIWSLGQRYVLVRIRQPQEDAGTAILKDWQQGLDVSAESQPHGRDAGFDDDDLVDGQRLHPQ